MKKLSFLIVSLILSLNIANASDLISKASNGVLNENSLGVKKLSDEEMKSVVGGWHFDTQSIKLDYNNLYDSKIGYKGIFGIASINVNLLPDTNDPLPQDYYFKINYTHQWTPKRWENTYENHHNFGNFTFSFCKKIDSNPDNDNFVMQYNPNTNKYEQAIYNVKMQYKRENGEEKVYFVGQNTADAQILSRLNIRMDAPEDYNIFVSLIRFEHAITREQTRNRFGVSLP